jgi:protein tyrosine phosphatase
MATGLDADYRVHTANLSRGPDARSPEALWRELEERTDNRVSFGPVCPSEEVYARYANVPCLEAAAVTLTSGQRLHANYMTDSGISSCRIKLIATQEPHERALDLFWQAIFETNSQCIIDLKSLADERDPRIGSNPYYPTTLNQTKRFGSVDVELIRFDDVVDGGNNRVYTYEITDLRSERKITVKRHCYRDWENGTVISLSALDALVSKTKELSPDPDKATWTHCKAGVGRTGTLITAVIIKEKITDGTITHDNFRKSLLEIVFSLREKRGHLVVQTAEQFELLFRYGMFLLNGG